MTSRQHREVVTRVDVVTRDGGRDSRHAELKVAITRGNVVTRD